MHSLPKKSSSQNKHHSRQTDNSDKTKYNLRSNETQVKKYKHRHKKPERSYRWTPLQHHRYITFLAENMHLFSLPQKLKIQLKIQQLMSNMVQERTSYQCRSHHQKMLTKHGSIQNIIKNHLEKLGVLKVEQIMDKQQLHFKSEDRKNQGLLCKIQGPLCKIQQYENLYIQPQINQMQSAGGSLLKEEQEVVYQTFS